MTDYIDLDTLKTDLGLDLEDSERDLDLADSITVASRAIDLTTGTVFGADTATARTYISNGYKVRVDRFTSTDGLIVKTGRDGDFSTTVAAADYVLWPYNAPANGGTYTRIDTPSRLLESQDGRPTVEVTAVWGYDTIPDSIKRACRLKAAQLYRRKDSPEGAIGSLPFGAMSVGKGDPDVWSLLAPYIIPGLA